MEDSERSAGARTIQDHHLGHRGDCGGARIRPDIRLVPF